MQIEYHEGAGFGNDGRPLGHRLGAVPFAVSLQRVADDFICIDVIVVKPHKIRIYRVSVPTGCCNRQVREGVVLEGIIFVVSLDRRITSVAVPQFGIVEGPE